MCGICGVVTFTGKPADMDAVSRMNATITHRGPDDCGIFSDGNCGLAMRRLSIIDTACGHQPMTNEDGNLVIVYNGEIYNHRELRRELVERGHVYRTQSDTETIVHLYEEYGRGCVDRLRGMFAFVIWDRRRRRLFAARDRLGIKPFYYLFQNGQFVFGSEIKAILAYPGYTPDLARDKVSEYLAFGYVSGAGTMFSGIQKLEAGHTLELDENGILTVQSYWDVPEQPDTRSSSYRDYVRGYRALLEECVESHLMSDVPLGVFLSGGLDSSAIAALTTKIRGDAIETFSVGYDEGAFSELPYAQAVAKHLGARHREIRVGRKEFFGSLPSLIWQEDEPLAFTSSVSLYFVARLASEHVKVVLTGEGSDETLAGYERYAFTRINARIDPVYRALVPPNVRRWLRAQIRVSDKVPALVARRLKHTVVGLDGSSLESLLFDNFYTAFSAADQRELLRGEVFQGAGDPYESTLAYWRRYGGDFVHKMLYTDIKTYLHELLMRQDQMSMAASIESRVPFLDHRLVEFAAGIPERFLLRGMTGKHVLKAAVTDLLPASIIYRKKMGFPTPWAHWLAGPQLQVIEDMLLEPRCLDRGLFQSDAMRRLLEEHRRGYRDRATQIWRLLNLELWQRIFIDGEAPPVARFEGNSEIAVGA